MHTKFTLAILVLLTSALAIVACVGDTYQRELIIGLDASGEDHSLTFTPDSSPLLDDSGMPIDGAANADASVGDASDAVCPPIVDTLPTLGMNCSNPEAIQFYQGKYYNQCSGVQAAPVGCRNQADCSGKGLANNCCYGLVLPSSPHSCSPLTLTSKGNVWAPYSNAWAGSWCETVGDCANYTRLCDSDQECPNGTHCQQVTLDPADASPPSFGLCL